MTFRLQLDQSHYNLTPPTIFSGGEVHIDLSHLPSKCHDYSLKARLQSNDDVMYLIMLCDALYRRYTGAKCSITIPYMPYARQDRMCADGQHFGMQAMAKLLGTIPQKRIITYDLHSPVAAHLLRAEGKIVREISQTDIIAGYAPLADAIANGKLQLVAPDNGAIKKVEAIEALLGGLDPAFGSKVRDPLTGQLKGFDCETDDFYGQDLLIVDDICDGGGTFIGLAEVLRERNCGEISLYVTHGIFSKGVDIFDGVIDTLYTTDSFRGKLGSKMPVTEIKL